MQNEHLNSQRYVVNFLLYAGHVKDNGFNFKGRNFKEEETKRARFRVCCSTKPSFSIKRLLDLR